MSAVVTQAPAKFGERLRFFISLFTDAATRYSDNEGVRLGASFSYYATFSIFPLLLLAITVVGFVIGDSSVTRDRLLAAVAAPGSPIRDVLEKTLAAMSESHGSGAISAVVGVVTLLFAASGAFVELDAALNRIWKVEPRKSEGVIGAIRVYLLERMSGFAIVAGLGLTLLISLIASATMGFFADQVRISSPIWAASMRSLELAFTIALLSAVFIAAFHYIPRTRPPVRDLVGGAILTTALLVALKEVFASYLSHLTSYSAYGVAGGVLALTTWIYLSSQIILFGAQLTQVIAERTETRFRPKPKKA